MNLFARPKQWWTHLRHFLRELSDESAYARHLVVTGRSHSRAEWQSFSDVRLRKKYQNGKCC